MKNNILRLREPSEEIVLGEYAEGKYLVRSFKNEGFLYGSGPKKLKNFVTVPGPTEFTYDVFKELLDRFGFDAARQIFGVCFSDYATRFAYRSFLLFAQPDGRKHFDTLQRMYDASAILVGRLNARYGFGEDALYHDRRVYYVVADKYICCGSVNPYHYIENSIGPSFMSRTCPFMLDVRAYESALKTFLAELFYNGLFEEGEALGFRVVSEREDDTWFVNTAAYIAFPKEYSVGDMCDWIFGEGGGKICEDGFLKRKL